MRQVGKICFRCQKPNHLAKACLGGQHFGSVSTFAHEGQVTPPNLFLQDHLPISGQGRHCANHWQWNHNKNKQPSNCAIHSQSIHDGNYLVLKINGHQNHALFDTGRCHTIIKQSFAEKIHLKLQRVCSSK